MLKGHGTQRDFILEPEEGPAAGFLQIGRTPQLCNVVLKPKTVSREHARITCEDRIFYIRDLSSKAGTILNGARLKPNVRYELKHRDLISICDFIFTFLDTDRSSDSGSSTEQILIVDSDKYETGVYSSLDSSAASVAGRTAANAMVKLAALMRLAQDLRSMVGLDRLLEKSLDSLLTMFASARCGIILLRGSDAGILPRSMARFREPESDRRVALNPGALHEVTTTGRALITEDRLTMCVPLLDRMEEILGVIQLDANPSHGRFQTDDLDLLLTAALQVSFAVEIVMLHEVDVRERAFEVELGIAHEIQMSLLPAERPDIPGYEFWDYYAPAKHVGGDYFDYRVLPGGRLAILLGDVSGKGVPAALLMTKAATEFKVFLSTGMSPVEVVDTVNQQFLSHGPEVSFMTMVLCLLDWSEHGLLLVNAGHLRPLLRRADGELVEIGDAESGLPLGVEPEAEYRHTEFSLAPGEVLLLITDGITDAQNAKGELYGLDRLRPLYSRAKGSATDIGQKILDDVGRFVGDNAQFDDTCLLCIRRCP